MKKNWKRALAVLLTALLVVGAAPAAGLAGIADVLSVTAAAETVGGSCGDNVTWSLDTETGELMISGTGEMQAFDWESLAPWSDYRDQIQSVTIGSGVTTVGKLAFHYYNNLTDVIIGNDVTIIGESAFSDCNKLVRVRFGNSVETICAEAFAETSLACAALPDSLTTIGDDAFLWCENLQIVHIPSGVTVIGESAFDYCNHLAYICSDTEDCAAKTFADSARFKFRVCDGHDGMIETVSGDCGKNGDNVQWSLKPDTGALTISGLGDMDDYDDCEVPWNDFALSIRSITIEDGVTHIGNGAFGFSEYWSPSAVSIGDDVVSIGDNAFFNCFQLLNLTIPDGVTTIGSGAFSGCTRLESLTIPDSVTTIGSYAFEGCEGLTQITIGRGLTDVGDAVFCFGAENVTDVTFNAIDCAVASYLFAGFSSLQNLTIGESVKTIPAYVFCGCTSLTSVTIPDSVTTIGESAFESCTNLSDITLSDNLTRICENAFWDTAYYDDADNRTDGVLYIGNHLIRANEIASDTYAVADGTRCIADYAFSGFDELTSVTLPNSVTSVGVRAFVYCSNLTCIHIPSGVTSIGEDAFEDCYSLEYICSDSENSYAKSYAEANNIGFRVCEGHGEAHTHVYTDEVTTEPTCTSAGVRTFTCACGDSYTESIPALGHAYDAAVTKAPTCTAEGEMTYTCSRCGARYTEAIAKLETGTYGVLTYQIADGEATITGCDQSASGALIIPDTIEGCPVTSIGDSAFDSCASLENVTIPNSVTSIADYAFCECESLASIVVDETNPEFSSDAYGVLFNKGKTKLIQYPIGNPRTAYTIPDGVTTIGAAAFSRCENLVNVTIPDSVKTIRGKGAFSHCEGLESITIPDSVESIGTDTFGECTGLTRVSIGENASMGDSVFEDCAGLTEVFYNAKSHKHGGSLFRDAGTEGTGIAVTFGDAVDVVPNRLFSEANVRSVVFGAKVTRIGSNAFNNCTGLTCVTIPNGLSIIGENAFWNCNSISDVYYYGTQEQWNAISVEAGNDGLQNADIHCLAFMYEGLACIETENHTIRILGCDKTWSDVRIPAEIEGKSVTEINSCAFRGNTGLLRLSIPKTVNTIGSEILPPFACESDTYHQMAAGWFDEIIARSSEEELADTKSAIQTMYDESREEYEETFGTVTVDELCYYLDHGTWPPFEPEKVYFAGSREEWNEIEIGANNDILLNAAIHFLDDNATLQVHGDTAVRGQTVQVRVSIDDNPGLIALRMHLQYDPQALTLTAVDNGEVFGATCFNPGGDLANVPFTMFWVDPLSTQNHDTNGTLVTFTFTVAEDAPVGDTPITLEVDAPSTFNMDLQAVGCTVKNGCVHVLSHLPGDADGDCEVTLMDVTAISRYLAGGWDVTIHEAAADVNGDAVVDLRDVILIRRFLAGGWGVELI